MNWEIKTYCNIIKKLKQLFTVLGIEFWSIYWVEWYRWGPGLHAIYHTDKEPCEVATIGSTDYPIMSLMVEDPIMSFIQKQRFFFTVDR